MHGSAERRSHERTPDQETPSRSPPISGRKTGSTSRSPTSPNATQIKTSRTTKHSAAQFAPADCRQSKASDCPDERITMTDASLEELGPVDYLVVEFPAGTQNFTGEMAKELLALVDAGTIRLIDVLILTKDQDGTVEPMELSDVGELGELQALEAQLAELLAEEDVANLAAAMDPGSTAGVLIWENLWAAPFASAARRSGGQLIANGRIPIQAIIASIEADEVPAT